MKAKLFSVVVLMTIVSTPAFAHRLDEYLQAVTVAVGHDRMQAQIRMTPGVAVSRIVLSAIDTNGNGVISATEQRAYAERVIRDLSFALDGTALPVRLVSWSFPDVAAMQEGRGDIVIDFDAVLTAGATARQLTLENRHHREIAVFLVNALVPTDPAIRIAEQDRNAEQSFYRLDFVDSHEATALTPDASFAAGVAAFIGAVLLLLVAPIIVSRRVYLRRRARISLAV
jgi:hypothetical protein